MNPITNEKAVEISFLWHGGMMSALYSFASTDGVVHSSEHKARLIEEVQHCIDISHPLNAPHQTKEENETDENNLEQLLRFIENAPVKE